jgi:penicillin-binding protein 2
MKFRKRKKEKVSFDEILLDASNLPSFNQGRMEGRMELPITNRNIAIIGILFLLISGWFLHKLFILQIVQGAEYKNISENNTIDQTTIIAERGVVYDRNGEMIAWNEPDKSDEYTFPMRAYTNREGLGQLTGYVSYPLKDAKGFYYRTEYVGRNGIEGAYNDLLAGINGQQLVERNAHGDVVGEHVVEPPVPGKELTLSIDAELSEAMYDIIATSTVQAGFRSGAAAIMDVHTGEIIAMTSYPSYDPEVMADGDDVALIEQYNKDERFPFLNKVLAGLYAPGSIVKPFMAYAALQEHIIDPAKIIVSTGEIVIPNPYDPDNPSRFTDWRAHGAMNMREAIAFSSNVYFYYISGGFGDQKGMGINTMKRYMDLFGFGKKTGVALANEQEGIVPSPEWKEEVFGEEWRLGNTYHTSIGQFGWQVTPLQMLVAYGALANGGKFFVPHLVKGETPVYREEKLDPESLKIIHEGMRMTTNYPGGTARALERKDVAIAAKSGTAELGVGNAYVNSWAAGFFPYEEPKYAFILMMDKAPRSNALGGTRVMGDIVEWMSVHTPEYLGIEAKTEETTPINE